MQKKKLYCSKPYFLSEYILLFGQTFNWRRSLWNRIRYGIPEANKGFRDKQNFVSSTHIPIELREIITPTHLVHIIVRFSDMELIRNYDQS